MTRLQRQKLHSALFVLDGLIRRAQQSEPTIAARIAEVGQLDDAFARIVSDNAIRSAHYQVTSEQLVQYATLFEELRAAFKIPRLT